MSTFWEILGLLAIFAVPFAWLEWKERRRLRQARERFLAREQPLSDADFLRKIGASGPEQEVCLAMRNAMARAGDVPPQMILPDDSLDSVAMLSFDGADQIEWIWLLEKELAIAIPDKALDAALKRDIGEMRVERCGVGEYVIVLARAIQPLIPPGESSSPGRSGSQGT